MIKGIAFDMDGLMFDTERLALKAWEYAGAQMGVLVEEDVALRTLGLNVENTKRVFKDAYGQDFNFDALRKLRVDYVYDHVEKNGMPIKAGLIKLLDYLKSNGYKMTVATSTEEEKARFYFTKAGICDYFGGIVCGDMIRRGKPEPDIYLRAAEIMGLAPDACMALEDSPNGILSAYRAGMKPVMVPDLVQPGDETRKLLYAEVPSLLDVICILEGRQMLK